MRPSTVALTLTLSFLAVVGCTAEENDPCRPGDRAGELATPDAMNREGCERGSLEGLDFEGLWTMATDPQPPFAPGPFRVEGSCQEVEVHLGYVRGPLPVQYAFASASDLFFREQIQRSNNWLVKAWDFCRVEEDGTLVGWYGECIDSPGGVVDCNEQREVRATRFGWLEGEDEAQGISLVAELKVGEAPSEPGFTSNVAVDGSMAYVTRYRHGLYAIDVSDPATPRPVGRLASPDDSFNDIALSKGPDGTPYAFVASSASGVKVVDVSDPARPYVVATFDHGRNDIAGAHRIFVETVDETTRLYSAGGHLAVVGIWDVTDPAAPIRLGDYEVPLLQYAVHAVSARNGRLFVSATVGGLFIVDATDPANPIELGRHDDGDWYSHYSYPATVDGREIVLHSNEGYDAHLEVIDVDPESDTFTEMIGEYQLRPQVSMHNLVVLGTTAYVAHYQDGLRVFDISEPTDPRLTAYFNTWDPERAPGALMEGAVDVEVAEGLIYVADEPRGLLILRED